MRDFKEGTAREVWAKVKRRDSGDLSAGRKLVPPGSGGLRPDSGPPAGPGPVRTRPSQEVPPRKGKSRAGGDPPVLRCAAPWLDS